jgi:hypothetical protein
MRIKPFISALLVCDFLDTSAAISPANSSILILSETPTATQDPWQCITEGVPQYFNVPKPTGSLMSAIFSYAGEVAYTCTELEQGQTKCPKAGKSRWCAFTTVGPTAVMEEFSSLASNASVWWTSLSDKAISVAKKCPNTWFREGEAPAKFSWLDKTIIFAECYHDAGVTTSVKAVATTQSTMAVPGSISSPTAAKTTTKIATNDGVWTRSTNWELLVVFGLGMIFAAINEL